MGVDVDQAHRPAFQAQGVCLGQTTSNGQGDPAVVKLTGIYHNLLRRWADA